MATSVRVFDIRARVRGKTAELRHSGLGAQAFLAPLNTLFERFAPASAPGCGPFAAAGAASALRGSRPDYAPAVGQIGCFRRQNRVEWPFPAISGGKTASRSQQLTPKSLISSLISLI
jgi:hypothetical protein